MRAMSKRIQANNKHRYVAYRGTQLFMVLYGLLLIALATSQPELSGQLVLGLWGLGMIALGITERRPRNGVSEKTLRDIHKRVRERSRETRPEYAAIMDKVWPLEDEPE